MVRVLLTDSDRFPFGPGERALLEEAGVALDTLPGHDPDDIADAAMSASAVFVYAGRFDRALIDRLGPCRVIARCGAGYDNIDVEAARRRGVVVTFVPDYGAVDVAEHTIALILACSRNLARCDREVQAGLWPSYRDLGPMHRVTGRTLGLLGFGRIARQVAIRAMGLGLRVLAHDPFVEVTLGEAFGVELVTFDALFTRSSFLSVHLPLNSTTRHIVDSRAISLLRPEAQLINTSRGAVVDQEALVRALDEGLVAGAGLDVLEREPPELSDRLMGRPNVLISPHSAALTEEALGELGRSAVLDVLRVLRGEPPLHAVSEPGSTPT